MSGSRANLIKCNGLATSGNELSLPEGSLRQATNVNIDEQGVITPRRGFNDYGTPTGGSETIGSQVKQLLEYKDAIIRHYQDKLEYEDSNGDFQEVTGSYSELRAGYRIKWQESNANVYFTTDDGIKKISAKNTASLNADMVEDAGGLKASYGEGIVVPTVGGYLTPNTKVAYRILYGTRDASNNLIFGSPSSKFIVTNYSKQEITNEQSTVTFTNAGGSPIVNGDYVIYQNSDAIYCVYFDTDGNSTPPKTADTIGSVYVKVEVGSSSTNANDSAVIFANDIANSITNVSVSIGTNIVTILSTEDNDIEGLVTVSSANGILAINTTANGDVSDGDFASVQITGVVPPSASTDHFYQIYRTSILEATDGFDLNDIDPGDEMNLVYESSVTDTDISNGEFVFTDTTPESFRSSSAPLYTNQVTGEGILQANEAPPIALDTALFRNSMFYANTKSRHRFTIDLVSIDDFVSDKTRLVIGNSTISRYYTFVGTTQVTEISIDSVPNAGDFLLAFSANDERKYSIYFGDTNDNPDISGAFAIRVSLDGTPNEEEIATRIETALLDNIDYTITRVTDTLTFTYSNNGYTTGISEETGTFSTITNNTLGTGELVDTTEGGDILLSGLTSVGQSIDETSRSLVKVISQDSSSPVNVFYLTTSNDLPGQLLFENRTLEDETFYIAIQSGYDAYSNVTAYVTGDRVSNSGFDYIALSATTGNAPSGDTSSNLYWQYIDLGGEFSPELTNFNEFTSISGNGDTTTVTLVDHGLETGDERFLSYLKVSGDDYDGSVIYNPNDVVEFNGNTYTNILITTGIDDTSEDPSGSINNNTYWNYTPETFAGVYTITKVDDDNFTIIEATPATVTAFVVEFSSMFVVGEESSNEESPNRIYFSKINEPEAVPIVNYIDVGPQDDEIQRILALRDNLFVLKDDGVYIISGTSAPNFSVRLLDNTKIIAPDSAVVLNNQIFCLTDQGVTMITDSGVGVISEGIKDLIDDVTVQEFDFSANTFGVAYENDTAYVMFAPTKSTDTTSTQAFRYNSFQRTWSRWEYNATCGHVLKKDNKIYLGDGDRNYVVVERKNNDRTDHAERSFTGTINTNGVDGTSLELSTLVNIDVNDAITQTQEVSISYFNNRLLKKSDFFDTGIELSGTLSTTNPVIFTTSYTHKLENNSDWDLLVKKDLGSGIESGIETFTITVIDDYNVSFEYDNTANSLISIDFRNYYYKTFAATAGSNMPNKLQAFNDHLAEVSPAYFDASRVFTFDNIRQDTIDLVSELNEVDAPTSIKTYKDPSTVIYEAYITSKDVLRNQVDVHEPRPWIEGEIEIFKNIVKVVEWNPQHFGDPSALKQIRYMTIMFDQNNFYDATAKFATDAAQAVKTVNFQGKGIGYWADMSWSNANHYWGGVGNDIPFRNPVPRDKQKCRYISLTFEHRNAREFFKIVGMTAVVRPISDRAYR